MAGVLDKFIEAHKEAKADEATYLDERRAYKEQLETTRDLLLKEICEKELPYIEVPPPEGDKDGKVAYIRVKRDTVQGAISLNGVAATLFGTEEERENPDTDIAGRWKDRLRAAMASLATKRAEAQELEAKKKEERAARLKKRRREVASIVKIHEEEAKKTSEQEAKGGGVATATTTRKRRKTRSVKEPEEVHE